MQHFISPASKNPKTLDRKQSVGLNSTRTGGLNPMHSSNKSKKSQNHGQQLIIKKAILSDMYKQRQRMTYHLNTHREKLTDAQRQDEEQKIKLHEEKIRCRELEIELLEYIHRDEFRKCALYIISAQKAHEKRGAEILNGRGILPGVSPISQMILGKNQKLMERQYFKNFSYLKQEMP
jgi:hypothetical protein